MEQYKLKDGVISIDLIPNYRLETGRDVVALVRHLEKNNYEEVLVTYYDEESDLLGLSYSKTFKNNNKVILNIRNDKELSYEYTYKAYDDGEFDISGSYDSDGNYQSVIIKQGSEERLFRKFLDQNGQIHYVFSDGKEKDSDGYQVLISYNKDENETTYGLYGSKYYFEFSEIREDDTIIENFYDDSNLILMYDGDSIYRGYQEDREIDPDKELESIINCDKEILDDDENVEYEEIELDDKYYKNNGHGPIYNYKVSKYIDNIDFYISGLVQNFPKLDKVIFSKDREYVDVSSDIFSDIDFDRLLVNINSNEFINNVVNNIKMKSRKK